MIEPSHLGTPPPSCYIHTDPKRKIFSSEDGLAFKSRETQSHDILECEYYRETQMPSNPNLQIV